MLFNTYIFTLVFAPASLAIFYFLRRFASPSITLAATVVMSLGFYAYWRIDYVPLLIGSILVNYALGTTILARPGTVARLSLLAAIALDLAFLGYFKYAHFAVAQANALFGAGLTDPAIVLPLAVSFYTFQQIAYLTDCYRGKIRDNNFLHYAFVVTFFPHLIAGPIVRMREISHQFSAAFTKPAIGNIAIGVVLFAIGLGKKVVIADYFGGVADPLFKAASTGPMQFAGAWTAALSYTLQLYFDFSGYSDMAIGLARMFGFRLAVNFLSPYQALDIAEFWRRWHITLSRFLRDYLYIPLGGSRRGPMRTYVNLIITMTLGGLWHGAAWTFVAWGLYHGALLSMHRAWRAWRPDQLARLPGYSLAAAGLTFFSVVAGWVLFRSSDFQTAATILRAMIRPDTISLEGQTAVLAVELGLLFCWIAPNVYSMLYPYRPALLLREQIALLRRREINYLFRFRTVEALALSSVLIVSLYQMRAVQSVFLYFMF